MIREAHHFKLSLAMQLI